MKTEICKGSGEAVNSDTAVNKTGVTPLGENERYTDEHIALDSQGKAYAKVVGAMTEEQRDRFNKINVGCEYDEAKRMALLDEKMALYATGARAAGLTFTGPRGTGPKYNPSKD
jgi:hypothetical protein